MDFDLSGMAEEEARSYVLSMATHLKQTENEVIALTQERDLWETRIATAQKAGRADLEEHARQKQNEVELKRSEREAEANAFRVGVESLKTQWKTLPALQRSVNPDLLLQALNDSIGTPDTVTTELRRHLVEEDLAALKRRLAEE